MLPIVFFLGLVLGLKRWPAVLALVATWPLFFLFFAEHPPVGIVEYWLVVLGNAAAGVAVHEIAAALRRVIGSVFRTLFHRREVGNGV